jgi:F0F1-type ATP synthase epsilon subunit
MVAQLTKGFLQIKTEQEEFFFTVDSGVLEVGPQSRVLILADNALPAKDLSEAQQQSYMHS